MFDWRIISIYTHRGIVVSKANNLDFFENRQGKYPFHVIFNNTGTMC